MPFDNRPIFERQHEESEGRFAGDEWQPKYPDAAVGSKDPLKDEPSEGDPGSLAAFPWHDAPSTSHLIRFRLIDARKSSFIRRFIGQSTLVVQFHATRTRPASEYEYYFTDFNLAGSIFEEMQSAAHPGHTVDQRLIKPRVRYRRTA